MTKQLHIGIAAPIATEHVSEFLTDEGRDLPAGYGTAPFTAVLIAELLKQGHRVSAFTSYVNLSAHAKTIKASGENFDFYICPERRRAWRFNNWRLGRALDVFAYERRMLVEAMTMAKPNIIHAHWTYEYALAAIKTCIPHLITCHDAPAVILRFNPYPYRAIRYCLARRVFQKGSHFSTVSDYMVKQLQHYVTKPIAVVPNPLAAFVLNNGQIRKKPQTLRIGLICNGWDTRKNPKPSLYAFAKLHQKQNNAELHLFGYDFGVHEKAQRWCDEKGLSQGMIFHGATPHKQVISLLNNLDLLLHPSLEESFGVVLAEAMALGLPIVAGRNSGAVPWVVGYDENSNECCAILTDVSDPDAILAAINTAFDENYEIRSAAGYARSRQLFTPEVITASYMNLYNQVIE